MATTTTAPTTAEKLERLPDDDHRYDLIRGELIRMSPAGGRHGRVAARVGRYLDTHVAERRLGAVFGAETGFVLTRNPDTVLGPDAAFVRADRLPPEEEQDGFLRLAPDLAGEIVSPSDSANYVHAKVLEYLDAGVPLVWVLDPRRRSVTAYRGADRTARVLRADTGDVLDGGDLLPDFRVAVANLFS